MSLEQFIDELPGIHKFMISYITISLSLPICDFSEYDCNVAKLDNQFGLYCMENRDIELTLDMFGCVDSGLL